MNQNNNQGQQPGLVNCAELIGKLPFWTRVVYFSLVGSWILDLITGIPSSFIASSVQNTFWSYQIWTVFTANFYVNSLFLAFIIIYNFNTFLPKLEEKISTTFLMLNFIINGSIIQLITLLFQCLFNWNNDLNGVEGIWFCMLFKFCYYNSQKEIKFCCFNWKFKRFYYPYILLGVCIILTFSIPLGMIVGLLYGLLQVNLQKITNKISANICYRKGNKILSNNSIKCWIRYGVQNQSEEFAQKIGYQNLQNFIGSGLAQNQSPENSINKDPFANQQGYRLGDY